MAVSVAVKEPISILDCRPDERIAAHGEARIFKAVYRAKHQLNDARTALGENKPVVADRALAEAVKLLNEFLDKATLKRVLE